MKAASSHCYLVIGVIVCMSCRMTTGATDAETTVANLWQRKGPSKPRLSSVTMNAEKNISVIEGDDVELRCEFIAESMIANWIKFTKSERTVVPPTRTIVNGSLHVSLYNITNVSKEDQGRYDCFAGNVIGLTSAGFELTVNERTCNNSECGEHGKCVVVNNKHVQCQCNEGFVGSRCQSVDHCMPDPCDNGGECETTENGFTCICLEGFTGKTCQSEKCLPNSCSGRGSCTESATGKLKCQCHNSYTGERCRYVCRNFGNIYCRYAKTCVIDENRYNFGLPENCYCENTRSSGRNCMLKKDLQNECAKADICNGHGDCTDLFFGYSCQCYSYYSGKNCEKFNECSAYADSRCRSYGGNCLDLDDGFNCSCPANQYGKFCEYNKKPCSVYCYENRMAFSCKMKFLSPALKYLSLKSNDGTCRFPSRYDRWHPTTTGEINYHRCGTTIEYANDSIVFRNSLSIGDPDSAKENSGDLIVRQTGYFKFDMVCKQQLNASNPYTSLSVKRIPMNESRIVQEQNNIAGFKTAISYYNSEWRNQAHYIVGERIFVQVQLNRRSNLQSYLHPAVLIPQTCTATPNRTSSYPFLTLLQDGCIKDKTLRFEDPSSSLDQGSLPKFYFSFESFGFKNVDDVVYMKCTVKLCVNKTMSAGDRTNKCKRKCLDKNRESTLSRMKRYAAVDDVEMAVIDKTLRRSIEFQ